MWHCLCDCGIDSWTFGSSLRRGSTQSCGCLQSELIAKRSKIHNKPWPLEERILDFWNKVSKGSPSECWLWNGLVGTHGYGQFTYNKKSIMTHRFSWFIHHGKMPDLLVLHKCDVRRCVNPDHLFEGTHQDNSDDKIRKGRNPKTLPGACKIDDDTVRLIRKLWVPYKLSMKKLALQLGLHIKTIETALYKRKGVI